MVRNITTRDSPSERREKRRTAFYFAQVTSVSRSTMDAVVRPLSRREQADPKPVLVSDTQDVHQLKQGDVVIVLVGEAGEEIIVGTLNQNKDIEYGDRVIGNSRNDSTITITRSGEIELNAPFVYVPRVSEDPENAEDGAVWYNETTNEYKGVEDGSTVVFDTTPE